MLNDKCSCMDPQCPFHEPQWRTTLADDELHDQDTQQGVWVNEGDDDG